MNRAVRIHPEALAEADAAVAWYERDREGLGRALKEDLDAVAARLATGLEDGTALRGRLSRTRARRVVLTRFRYDVVFLIRHFEVVILAYSHHSRRPGYWRERLKGA